MTGPESAANVYREARGQSGAPRDDAPAAASAPSPRWVRVVVHPGKPPPPTPATTKTVRRRRRPAPSSTEPPAPAPRRTPAAEPAAELLRDDRGREMVRVGGRVYRPTWQDLDADQLTRF